MSDLVLNELRKLRRDLQHEIAQLTERIENAHYQHERGFERERLGLQRAFDIVEKRILTLQESP